MSARRACCRYTNGDLDKGFVPNRPCQPNANPFGVSFVSSGWRCDETLDVALSRPYDQGDVCNLGGRRGKETRTRGSGRADVS
jgi:hypothetical protein